MRSRRPVATLTVGAELLPLLRELLARGGHLPLVARGDSMRPALRSGDRLVLGPVDGAGVRPGEIVLWSHRGRVVVHRVVELRGSELRTRGDAAAEDDGWVPRAAVLGRVVRSQRGSSRLGRVLRFFLRRSPLHARLREVWSAGTDRIRRSTR